MKTTRRVSAATSQCLECMLTTAEQVRPLALWASEAGAHDRTQNMLLHWLEPSILQAHAMWASPKCVVNIHQSYLWQSSLSPALLLLWTDTDNMTSACCGALMQQGVGWVVFTGVEHCQDRQAHQTVNRTCSSGGSVLPGWLPSSVVTENWHSISL